MQGPIPPDDLGRINFDSAHMMEKDQIAQGTSMCVGNSSDSDPAYTYAASQNQQQQYILQEWDENAFFGMGSVDDGYG